MPDTAELAQIYFLVLGTRRGGTAPVEKTPCSSVIYSLGYGILTDADDDGDNGDDDDYGDDGDDGDEQSLQKV